MDCYRLLQYHCTPILEVSIKSLGASASRQHVEQDSFTIPDLIKPGADSKIPINCIMIVIQTSQWSTHTLCSMCRDVLVSVIDLHAFQCIQPTGCLCYFGRLYCRFECFDYLFLFLLGPIISKPSLIMKNTGVSVTLKNPWFLEKLERADLFKQETWVNWGFMTHLLNR